jgi:hypothetical protein
LLKSKARATKMMSPISSGVVTAAYRLLITMFSMTFATSSHWSVAASRRP